MGNKPLIRPAISWGGTLGGGRLTSHDFTRLHDLFTGLTMLTPTYKDCNPFTT